MIVAIEPESVGILFDDPLELRKDHPGVHESAIPREAFESYYHDVAHVRQVAYEPKRGIYHIMYHDGKVEGFESPDDHPIFQALARLEKDIIEEQLIIKRGIYRENLCNDFDWLDMLGKISDELMIPRGQIRRIEQIPNGAMANKTVASILSQYGIDQKYVDSLRAATGIKAMPETASEQLVTARAEKLAQVEAEAVRRASSSKVTTYDGLMSITEMSSLFGTETLSSADVKLNQLVTIGKTAEQLKEKVRNGMLGSELSAFDPSDDAHWTAA